MSWQEILPVRAFGMAEQKTDFAAKGRNNGSCFSLCSGGSGDAAFCRWHVTRLKLFNN